MGGRYLTVHANTFKTSTTKKNMMLVNKTNKSTNREKIIDKPSFIQIQYTLKLANLICKKIIF